LESDLSDFRGVGIMTDRATHPRTSQGY